MVMALVWGAVGVSALLIGALLAYHLAPSRSVMAVIMALGTGLLIGSISFESVDEALRTSTVARVGGMVLVGAGVFTLGDWLLTRHGGGERKDAGGAQTEGSSLGIVLGSILDGIPESFVLGVTVLHGGVGVSLLAGVALSNLPEGLVASAGLRAARWPERRVVLMWLGVVLVSAVSAAAGYVIVEDLDRANGSLAQAFAAGALLAIVADTLLPEAYAVANSLTGPLVAAGFAASLVLSAI